jgi:hypothetical protein
MSAAGRTSGPIHPSLSADAINARLREASRLAGSLKPERRLDTKIDLSGAGVARRLNEASELLELCRALARAGEAAPGARGRSRPVSR